MHLVYISKPRFESFDKPHVAVLQSAGFKNAFRAILSGYARIKRPKQSTLQKRCMHCILQCSWPLACCFLAFFPLSWLFRGGLEAFSFPLQTHSVSVSIVFGQLWVSEVVRSTVNRHHGVACCIVHLSHHAIWNIWKLHVNIHQDLPMSHSFFKPCWHLEQQFPQTLSSVVKTAQRDVLLPWSGLSASKMESFQKCDQSYMTIHSPYLSLRNISKHVGTIQLIWSYKTGAKMGFRSIWRK